MTIMEMLPEMAAWGRLIEREPITAMSEGTLAGGPEEAPGSLVHVPPHVGEVVLVILANPLKALGAGPSLSEFIFAH